MEELPISRLTMWGSELLAVLTVISRYSTLSLWGGQSCPHEAFSLVLSRVKSGYSQLSHRSPIARSRRLEHLLDLLLRHFDDQPHYSAVG